MRYKGIIPLSAVTMFFLQTSPARAELVMSQAAYNRSHPTSDCDDFIDQIESVGEAVADGAIYMGDWTVRSLDATVKLVSGNPDAFIDQINRTWRDFKTANRYLFEKGGPGGLLLGPLLKEVIPNGAFEDFLSDATNITLGLWADVADTALTTVENDVAEISHDLWDVVENIDDPEAFAEAFAKKMQKWNPAASLSYVFTEDDPIKGLQKAAASISRQIDIVTTYVMPYTKGVKVGANPKNLKLLKKIQNKLKGRIVKKTAGTGAKGVAKELGKDAVEDLVKEMVTDAFLADMMKKGSAVLLKQESFTNKKAQAAMALLMASINAQVRSRTHPFYNMEVRNVYPEWMKDNYKDGTGQRWSVWHPTVENNSNCISLGDVAYKDRGARTRVKPVTKAICGPELWAGLNKWWARPINYKLVWGDNCSGSEHDRSIWAPVCPKGFLGVGFVGWGGSWKKPLPNRIACLRNDPDLFQMKDLKTAGYTWLANDKSSGAKYDLTVYGRKFAGLDNMMFALPFYPGNHDTTASQIQVPVAWGVPSPNGMQSGQRGQWADINIRSSKPKGRVQSAAQRGDYTKRIVIDGSNRVLFLTSTNIVHEQLAGKVTVVGEAYENKRPGWFGFLQIPGIPNATGLSIDDKDGLWNSNGNYIGSQVGRLVSITPHSVSKGLPPLTEGIPSNSNVQQDQAQNTPSPQWNVGDSVEVLRPEDERWTAANVMDLDARNGVLIRYKDSAQLMWVPENIVRMIQSRDHNQQLGDHGSLNQGYDNQGSYNQGSTTQGYDNRGSYNQGNTTQGYDNQGSYNQGSATQGYDNRGSYNQGSTTQGYDNRGSYNQGNTAQGYDNQGSYDQGSTTQGYDNQGSYNQGSTTQGYDNQGSYNQGYSN